MLFKLLIPKQLALRKTVKKLGIFCKLIWTLKGLL